MSEPTKPGDAPKLTEDHARAIWQAIPMGGTNYDYALNLIRAGYAAGAASRCPPREPTQMMSYAGGRVAWRNGVLGSANVWIAMWDRWQHDAAQQEKPL